MKTVGQHKSGLMKRSALLNMGGFALLSVFCLGLQVQSPLAGSGPVAVVELFTSQGCSSCPPADKYLSELAADPNVIALTEAVDYWDYLGWADKNARHENTVRQHDYAAVRGDRRVYTPQMVINGRVHVVGSRRDDIKKTIHSLAQKAKGLSIPITMDRNADALTINVASRPDDAADITDGTLYLVQFNRAVTAQIERGENRGRSITYHNVVTSMQPVGMWHGDALKVELPLRDIHKDGHDGCAVLLQADNGGLPGPIFGAAKIDLP
ncbi:thioredoxin family protein [Cohaesibacter sp. ES.047]|uniref:DUF1223 domain-containing protein n=1 Tax=Cohaesibacter sp. ES.047 TaxID=1798205 RepID=UPI000BB7B5AC|nr:DUF1223 domain-containing protein [Cohaesibacter sp. ES.047]